MPILILILVVILNPSHSAGFLGQHQTRAYIEHAASTRTGPAYAWGQDHGCQRCQAKDAMHYRAIRTSVSHL
jgi:hypothetical protein